VSLLDNAGGSQLPAAVIDAMTSYMRGSFVQTGADYAHSTHATQTVQRAHQFLKLFVHACTDDEASRLPEPYSQAHTPVGLGEVIIGPSTSQLCSTLAQAYAQVLREGDEIIVCDTAHESNVGPWQRLASKGVRIRRWAIDWQTATGSREQGLGAGGSLRVASLRALLSPRTKLVCFPQVSNILGEIVDARAITALAHSVGARVVVDGVACAPHRAIDVRALGCDWYVWSTYKVFGPHAAAMFGTHDALRELTGPNHFFIPQHELPRKFELGGANHESCAGIVALDEYLKQLVALSDPHGASSEGSNAPAFSRARIERAFAIMEALEQPLQDRFLSFLAARPRLRVVGPGALHDAQRVCTIAFVDVGTHASPRLSSKQLAQALNRLGHGVRFGNFYAYRLCEALQHTLPEAATGTPVLPSLHAPATPPLLHPSDGVVRASFAHYNTLEEVDALCDAIDSVLASANAAESAPQLGGSRAAVVHASHAH
jgi:selenocysteine lyase/cysteine desulfurase